MITTRQKIIESLTKRLAGTEIAPQNTVSFLKNLNIETIVDLATAAVYIFTRCSRSGKNIVYFNELICNIGHTIRNQHRMRRDSRAAAKSGAFILYAYEEMGLLQVRLGKGTGRHAAYTVNVTNDAEICAMWEALPDDKVEKLPSTVPYAPWTSYKHETGHFMIKTQNKNVLDMLDPAKQPMIFECLNKSQEVGWNVNKFVYNLHLWAIRNKTDAFAEIWELQNPISKSSKLREVDAIGSIAGRFLDKTFYHLYSYDFRGRKYVATAYLHEQGTDLARGLLLRADKKVIGEQGFYWLLISIASNWAGDAGREDSAKTDKIPLNDRVMWALDNEEIILSYAMNPKVNQGWMKADKPWQFIAACYEFFKFRVWQSENKRRDFEYESQLECYIDG